GCAPCLCITCFRRTVVLPVPICSEYQLYLSLKAWTLILTNRVQRLRRVCSNCIVILKRLLSCCPPIMKTLVTWELSLRSTLVPHWMIITACLAAMPVSFFLAGSHGPYVLRRR